MVLPWESTPTLEKDPPFLGTPSSLLDIITITSLSGWVCDYLRRAGHWHLRDVAASLREVCIIVSLFAASAYPTCPLFMWDFDIGLFHFKP